MIGVLLVSVVTAQVAMNIIDARFTPNQPKVISEIPEGDITFDCGKEQMSVHIKTRGDIDKAFEAKVKTVCSKEVSNAINWKGEKYKQNELGDRSFDDLKLENSLPKVIMDAIEQTPNFTYIEPEEESLPIYECVDDSDLEECPGGLSMGLGTRCYFTKLKMITGWNFCSGGWILQ